MVVRYLTRTVWQLLQEIPYADKKIQTKFHVDLLDLNIEQIQLNMLSREHLKLFYVQMYSLRVFYTKEIQKQLLKV